MKEQYTLGTGIDVFFAKNVIVDASDRCVKNPDFTQILLGRNRTIPLRGRNRPRILQAARVNERLMRVLFIAEEIEADLVLLSPSNLSISAHVELSLI
jgi:hypothetical protein